MIKQKNTTIQVSIETREELKSLGSKGETYDDIIRKLLKLANECKEKVKE